MKQQAGYTLIELVITIAIITIVVGSGIGMAMASRPTAVTAAVMQFDALLTEGRTIGREFDTGATIVFAPKAPDGFRATLYRNRPSTLPLAATNTPIVSSDTAIAEQETTSEPGFAIAIHANGDIAVIHGYTAGASGSVETACPASNAYHVTISYAGNSVSRLLPCRAVLATTGTPSFAPFPPAPTTTPAPATSSCITNCTSIPLPQATPSCPAGMIAVTPLTCVGVSSAPSPQPTCPPGFPGTPPYCNQQAPPSPSASPLIAPCIADQIGYCWYNHSSEIQFLPCGNIDGWHTYEPTGPSIFVVYDAKTGLSSIPYEFLYSFFDPTQEGDDECYTASGWQSQTGEGDPTTLYPQDPDLEATITNQLFADSQQGAASCSTEQQCGYQ